MTDSTQTRKVFAQRLAAARSSRGMSQSALARALKTAPATINHFEAGRRTPNLKNLVGLCVTLKVSADYLLGVENQIG